MRSIHKLLSVMYAKTNVLMLNGAEEHRKYILYLFPMLL